MGPPQNWSFCGERRSKGAGVVFAFRQKQSQADFATTTPGGWSALLRPQYSTMRSYFRATERAHQHWDRAQELDPLRQFLVDQTAKTWQKQIARMEKQKDHSVDR